MVGDWQGNEDEQAFGRAVWIADERPRGAPACVESTEEHRMFGDPTTRRATVHDHQGSDDTAHVPTALHGDPRSKPYLDVEAPNGVLHIPYASLSFGYFEDAVCSVERELINPSALAIDAVAGFVPDLPACSPMPVRPYLHQPGVIGVQQAIDIATTTPPDFEIGAAIEGVEHASDDGKRVSVDTPSLHVRDCRRADSRPRRQVRLAPPAALPEDEDHATNAPVVHRRSMHTVAYRPLTGRLLPGANHRRLRRWQRPITTHSTTDPRSLPRHFEAQRSIRLA